MDTMIANAFPFVFKGIWMTIKLMAVSTFLSYLFAFLLGFARMSSVAVIRGMAYVVVELFRGTSLLIQLFWIYYCLPYLFGWHDFPTFAAAMIAIGLNFGAYGSEIVRSTILTIPKGQTEAAIALNYTPVQRMIHIILPQALLRMLPPFGNLQIELLKSTSLVYFIGLPDIFYRLTAVQNNYIHDIWLMYLFVLILYFVMAKGVIVLYRWMEHKLSAGRI